MTVISISPPRLLSRDAFVDRVEGRIGPSAEPMDGFACYVALAVAAGEGVDPDPRCWKWNTLDELYERYVLAVVDDRPRQVPPATHALSGRYATLRPLLAEDLSWAALFLSRGRRFSAPPLRGRTPSPAELADLMWRDTLCVFVAQAAGSGEPWGIVRAHTPSPAGTSAAVDLWLDDDVLQAGWAVEAWLLLVDHLFHQWPLDTLRMELTAVDHAVIASADGRLLRDEGTLREHLWCDGQYRDVHLRSLPRPVWEEQKPILLTGS